MQLGNVIQMPIQERRKREKKQRESDIIDAAEKLFIEKGFEGTSMDDVAEAVELSKPAIYRYFASKEDLYFAVTYRSVGIVNSMMEKYVEESRTGIEKAYATGRAYYDFYRKYPDQYRMIMNIQYIGGAGHDSIYLKKISEATRGNLKLMCNAIDEGKKDGTLREDFDTMMAAIYFMESLTKAIEISPGHRRLLELKGKSHHDFVTHSMGLMLRSIEKDT
jgi:AcrR family transcriptional regulator